MKRALALVLTLIMCCSVFALAGCKKQKNADVGPEAFLKNYNFESYVAEDSKILGKWKEVLKEGSASTNTEWNFEKTTALNIIETVGGKKVTLPCGFNYNEKTNQLIYIVCDSKKVMKYTATIDGNTMTLSTADGEVVKTLKK